MSGSSEPLCSPLVVLANGSFSRGFPPSRAGIPWMIPNTIGAWRGRPNVLPSAEAEPESPGAWFRERREVVFAVRYSSLACFGYWVTALFLQATSYAHVTLPGHYGELRAVALQHYRVSRPFESCNESSCQLIVNAPSSQPAIGRARAAVPTAPVSARKMRSVKARFSACKK
jgi:hypothetical protein